MWSGTSRTFPTPPDDDLDLPDGLFLFTDLVSGHRQPPGTGHGRGGGSCGARPFGRGARTHDTKKGERGPRSWWIVLKPGPAFRPWISGPSPSSDPPFSSSLTRQEFEEGVERIKEYIRAGDAFQVVLSQRLDMPFQGRPFDLYRVLGR